MEPVIVLNLFLFTLTYLVCGGVVATTWQESVEKQRELDKRQTAEFHKRVQQSQWQSLDTQIKTWQRNGIGTAGDAEDMAHLREMSRAVTAVATMPPATSDCSDPEGILDGSIQPPPQTARDQNTSLVRSSRATDPADLTGTTWKVIVHYPPGTASYKTSADRALAPYHGPVEYRARFSNGKPGTHVSGAVLRITPGVVAVSAPFQGTFDGRTLTLSTIMHNVHGSRSKKQASIVGSLENNYCRFTGSLTPASFRPQRVEAIKLRN